MRVRWCGDIREMKVCKSLVNKTKNKWPMKLADGIKMRITNLMGSYYGDATSDTLEFSKSLG